MPPTVNPDRGDPQPRPRVYGACAVAGCFGLAGLAAIGVLIYVAILLFTHLADDGTQDAGGSGGNGRARPGPVTPTQLAKDRDTVELGGDFDAVCRAAGGRYLVLRIPSRQQLAVFDPTAAAVIKTLDVDDPKALFAGTAGKLFVYRPKAHRLDRYDLLTWEREHSARGPRGLTSVDAILAGPGSDGPVLLVGERSPSRADVAAVDADTFEVGPVRTVEWRWPAPARVSHDGRLIGLTGITGLPPGGLVVPFTPGAGFDDPRRLPQVGHVAPSPDGRFVYTAMGVYGPDGAAKLRPGGGGYFYTLPTAQGSDLFVSVAVDSTGQTPALRPPVQLHLAGDRAAAARLPADPPRGLDPRDVAGVPADLRVHLWPAAGLLAVLPADSNRLELHKVDVGGLLKTSRKDYLVIGSDPPTTAARGSVWSYRPAVWSGAAGAPTVKVTGPPGFNPTAPPNGTITWLVPKDFPQPEVELRVEASDGRRTAEQTFRVVLTDPQ